MSQSSDRTRSDRSYMALAGVALGLIAILAVLMALPNVGPLGRRAPTSTLLPAATLTATASSTPIQVPTQTPTPVPLPTDTPEPTATATRTPTPSPTKEPTLTETRSPTPLPSATSTPSEPGPADPTATVTDGPTATAMPADATPITARPVSDKHDWLHRPIGEEYWQSGSIYYPYASTGRGQYLLHHGIDMGNPIDTPVLAATDGDIVFAGTDDVEEIGPMLDFYGKAIIIRADRELDGLPVYCLYGHLNLIEVSVGQRVSAGQQIGSVGMTGIAIGPHLHFEIRLGVNDYGHSVNPDLWMEPLPGLGTIAGRVIDSQGEFLDEHLITVHQAAAPDKLWREALTYIREEGLGPDPLLNENFLLADVYEGTYILKTRIEGVWLTAQATLRAGETVFVEFQR